MRTGQPAFGSVSGMDDEGDRPPEPAQEAATAPELPQLPPEVFSDADELRQLIDAGAGSPEELRALAARIREHRELEESLWRRDVKPALLESKKRRFDLGDLRKSREADQARNSLWIGLGILAVVLLLFLLAAQASALFVIVPAVAVLIVAYWQGRRESAAPDVDAAEGPAD